MAEQKEQLRVLLACAEQKPAQQALRLLREDGRFMAIDGTADGRQAWQRFKQYDPALTVLDTELPYLDGLVLSRRIRSKKGRGASILLLSTFMGAQVYAECRLLQIDALMRKPFLPEALYERICLLGQCLLQEDVFQQRAGQILREIRVPEGTKGYRCVACVFNLFRKASDAGITKEIYPDAEKILGMERDKIERNMRYALRKAWSQCDPDVLERYFGKELARQKSIGNRAFCAALLNYLRQEEKLW